MVIEMSDEDKFKKYLEELHDLSIDFIKNKCHEFAARVHELETLNHIREEFLAIELCNALITLLADTNREAYSEFEAIQNGSGKII
ncbi:MAG: hypothetical protein A3E87_01795 [Gammaproteobacteria bacterium RIFCSPHIGHO2_12_FULL_35_23]|nr:MAG: hypothetical protein A3E87_01795 [Gammaproteobacteria bacterium RIFCSPHIGHO2_12_FULL_35_23]